jgi:hypothetical protein
METEIKAKPELKVIKEEEIQHILEPGEFGAVLELVVSDKDGKVIEKRVLKSRSFVRQFLELLWVQAMQVPASVTYSVRDTGNTLRGLNDSIYSFNANAGAGDATYGIIVGTGTNTPTITDYALQTPIAHGSGAGQLQYGGVTFVQPASDSTTSQFTITRGFSNASGSAIAVNEIGLYVKGRAAGSQYNFMAIRDVIAGGISVPNGQTLTVNYREQAVV